MVRAFHGAPSEFEGNIATEYGRLHEPLAIIDYIGASGNSVDECGFFVNPEHNWLGATPDGLIYDDGVLEVKCPFGLRNQDAPVFKSAAEQPHYFAQMQIEMYCTGRTWCDFFQWAKNGVYRCERVEIDLDWLEDAVPKLKKFHEWYETQLANPAHLEPREREINTLIADQLIKEYDAAKAAIDDAEARKKEILAELVKISGDQNAVICGRKLTRVERVGNVDYKKIPELQGVDLEKYRGKGSSFWQLR